MQCCKQGKGSGEGLQLALGLYILCCSYSKGPCSVNTKLLGTSEKLLQSLDSNVRCSQNIIDFGIQQELLGYVRTIQAIQACI